MLSSLKYQANPQLLWPSLSRCRAQQYQRSQDGFERKRMGLAAMLDHDLQYAFSCAARQATASKLRRLSRRSKHDRQDKQFGEA